MTTTLPFSAADYAKLDRAVFPTLRRRDKYGDVGDVVEVVHGPRGDRERIGMAKIVAKETVVLRDLPTSFLCYDTETPVTKDRPHRQARRSLNRFYRDEIGAKEPITLYWLRWVEQLEVDSGW